MTANRGDKSPENPKAEAKGLVERGIDQLFSEPSVPTDVACEYLRQLSSNLVVAEMRLERGYAYMAALVLAFFLLDTGILRTLPFQGGALERTGLLMILFPVILSFMNYQATSRVHFIHELRTAVALTYKKMNEAFYQYGLDLLTHYPSIRNLETFQSITVGFTARGFISTTTTLVALCLGLGPLIAVAYFLYRTWHFSDLPRGVWAVAAAISLILSARTFLIFALDRKASSPYVERPRGKWST